MNISAPSMFISEYNAPGKHTVVLGSFKRVNSGSFLSLYEPRERTGPADSAGTSLGTAAPGKKACDYSEVARLIYVVLVSSEGRCAKSKHWTEGCVLLIPNL